MKGWVYVISNRAMPDLVKVGFSTKDPKLRAEELGHTGSPHPYVVEYEVLVEDPMLIEQAAHRLLSSSREGKEWFRCATEVAVAAIRKSVGSGLILENCFYVDQIKLATLETEEKARLQAAADIERQRRELEQKRAQEAKLLDARRVDVANWLRMEEEKITSSYRGRVDDARNESFVKYLGDLYHAWLLWLVISFLALILLLSNEMISRDAMIALAVAIPTVLAVIHVNHRRGKRRETAERARDEMLLKIDAMKYRSVQCKICGAAARFERAGVMLQPNTRWHCANCKSPLEVPSDWK